MALAKAASLAAPADGAALCPKLSVIIPTFNERANVPILIDRIAEALGPIPWEAIVVDDDSPDGTANVARELAHRDPRVRCIRRVGRRGLAGACIEGMLAAQGDYVAVIDADLQHDEKLLPKMFAVLDAGEADVVIGSRHIGDGSIGEFARTRAMGSDVAGWLARRLLGLTVTDPMSGFFMVRRQAVEEVAPRLSSHGFKILVDILASSEGRLRVRELPYTFQSRIHGESKLDERVVLDYLELLIAKATHDLVPTRFVNFLLVGASGLVVHMIILKLALSWLALSFAAGQVAATIVAMTSNFFLNNYLTFRDRRLKGLPALQGLLLFYLICAVGAVSNLGVANWIFAHQPIWWLAGLAGAAVGAVWNYVVSTELVWRARPFWRRNPG